MRTQSLTLPRSVEDRVERVARRLRKPRRVVLKEAVDECAARHDPEAVRKAVDRVADAVDTHQDAGLAAAARSILERGEW